MKTIYVYSVLLLFIIILVVNPATAQNAGKQTRLPIEGTILVAGTQRNTIVMSPSCQLPDAIEKKELRVEIYDLNGRCIFRDSVSRMQTPDGIAWDGRDDQDRKVRPGYYFFRISTSRNLSPSPMAHQTGDLYFWDVTASHMPIDSTYPWDMECGDIDNDGDVDIVMGCQERSKPGQSRLLINNGTGIFDDETEARLPSIQAWTTDIDLADIDGDGDLDMFLNNADEGEMDLLLVNDGQGYFSDETSGRLPQDETLISSMVFADIDEDNDKDMTAVVCNPSVSLYFGVQIFLNDGEGFFVKAADRTPPLKTSLWEISAADVDGDGDTDLFLPALGEVFMPDDTLSGQNSLLINDGYGYFSDQTAERMPINSVTLTKKIKVGDIDGDKDVDLYLVNIGFEAEQAKDRLYINDGQGHFTDETTSRLLGQGIWWTNDNDFADCDLDGDLDLFVANVVPGGYAFDELLLNDGTGIFTDRSYLLPEVFDFSTACALGDVDGDTDVDIVTANLLPPTASSHDGQDRLYLNMLVTDAPMPGGDVNNDGQIDVSDVYLCVRIITHEYQPHYPEFLRADLNRDNSVNALDVVSMIRMILQNP